MSQFRFVVDIPQSEIPEFLDLIAEYNMTNQYYSYIFTDWDTQFLDPKAFAVDKGANFTTISLTNIIDQQYQFQPQHVTNRQNFERSSKAGVGSEAQTANRRESLVWGYVLIAYVGVSMALFFVARFSPYEWRNPHPCNADSEVLENTFNMLNSLWFTLGSLMQKGSDILPRATSTRIVAGFWWFFTLIIISSYTANLAAFLTVERMKAPIEDVNDLAKQTKIKYGTREGGSSAAFFEKSNLSVYQRMWQFMSSNKNVMMNSTKDAIARVKRGGYAYILESSVNEYYTQRNCELMQVGNNLDSKGYGIGFPQGSKYRDSFSEVILQLQRSQTLEEMRRYWWGNYSIVEPCNDQPKKSADATSLGVEQVGGCFVMVLVGLGASFLVGLTEFLYKAHQRSKVTKASQ
nr:unnamed protein product [Spirometra erinaceieuropaei]